MKSKPKQKPKQKPKRLPIDNGFVKTKLPQSEIVIDSELFRLETEMNNENKESKIESNNKRIEELKEMLNPKNKQQRDEDYAQLFTKLGSRLPPGITEHITSYIHPVVGDIVLTNIVTHKMYAVRLINLVKLSYMA
jgi:hypothetical protein